MKKLSVLAFLILILLSPMRLQALSTNSQVNVTIINCEQDLDSAPTVRVAPYATPANLSAAAIAVVSTRRTEVSGVYSVDLNLDPGNYLVTAMGPHCHTPSTISLTVFAGHSRHLLTVAVRKYTSLRSINNSSLGVLTPRGVLVELFNSSSGSSSYGVKDDSVTYFSDVAPGAYSLRVWVNNVVACADVVVPNEGHDGYRRFISFDLSSFAIAIRKSSESVSPHTCSGLGTLLLRDS